MDKFLVVLFISLFFTSFVSNELVKLSIDIHPGSEEIQPGEGVSVQISIVNKAVEKGDIIVKYTITDQKGNILDKEIETMLLTTRITHLRSLEVPETAKKGIYSFSVEVTKEGKILGIASDIFYVGRKPFFTIENILIILVAMIIITLLIIIYEMKKIKKHMKIDEKILLKEKLIKLNNQKTKRR